jgi:hypothetical protein
MNFPEFANIMGEYSLLLLTLWKRNLGKIKNRFFGFGIFFIIKTNKNQWNKRYDILVVSSTKEVGLHQKHKEKLLKKENRLLKLRKL